MIDDGCQKRSREMSARVGALVTIERHFLSVLAVLSLAASARSRVSPLSGRGLTRVMPVEGVVRTRPRDSSVFELGMVDCWLWCLKNVSLLAALPPLLTPHRTNNGPPPSP